MTEFLVSTREAIFEAQSRTTEFEMITRQVVFEVGDRLVEFGAPYQGAPVGEVNTASNVGGGVGVYKEKIGNNFSLRSIVSTDDALTVALSGDGDEVELGLTAAVDDEVSASATDTTPGFLDTKITPGNGLGSTLLNPGAGESIQLDVATSITDHLIDSANPHGTDLENLGAGTLAELNGAITDHSIVSTKSTSIADVVTAEKFHLGKYVAAMTIRSIGVVLQGSASPSVTWELRHGTDFSAAGTVIHTATTTNVTTGDDVASPTTPSVPAGSHVWVEFTAVSGTVDVFNLSFEP